MIDPLATLPLDRPVTVQFADGVVLRGVLRACGGGWLRLEDQRGVHWVQTTQVAMISALSEGEAASVDGALPKPRSADAPVKTTRAPGRPWADGDLKALAEAFLDGVLDSDCAQRFNRTRHQITLLRQGFEAARGGLDEDRIPDVARTWVQRWRRALAG